MNTVLPLKTLDLKQACALTFSYWYFRIQHVIDIRKMISPFFRFLSSRIPLSNNFSFKFICIGFSTFSIRFFNESQM